MTRCKIRRLEKAVNYSPDLDVRELSADHLADLATGIDPEIERWIESLPDDALKAIVEGVNLSIIEVYYGGPDD